MANYVQSGYKSPGVQITVDAGEEGTINIAADTLVLNGEKQTLREWVRRGVLRTVTATGSVNTYYIESPPEGVGKI
jgi:hypothetical protein